MTDKLTKAFLLVLRSDSPGEAMAAREALLRIARGDDCDAHDLARSINLKKRELTVREMADRCLCALDVGGWLSDKEKKFCRDMLSWGRPSEMQTAWITLIFERLKAGGYV